MIVAVKESMHHGDLWESTPIEDQDAIAILINHGWSEEDAKIEVESLKESNDWIPLSDSVCLSA